MPQDKELEIQLQFLEEAQEYLDTIESVLLGLASSHIDGQKMDAVLRAAHSVKGGAGMMGFQTLSQLAHRLEDSFKVLKAQRNSIEFDAELESLLLTGLDRLRHVLKKNCQGTDVDQQWLKTEGNPIFEKLRERLGDPVADDASTILGSEEGTSVTALLFETEVEGCLSRLEAVLADPQMPCLEEELSIMAQELEGLGEMLQLSAFSSLCQSVTQNLAAAPKQVMEIAQLALQAWRRAQALVLVGQTNNLPTQIEFLGSVSASATQGATFPTPKETVEENWTLTEVVEENWGDLEVLAAEFDHSLPEPETIKAKDDPAERLYDDVSEEEAAFESQRTSLSREFKTFSESVVSSESDSEVLASWRTSERASAGARPSFGLPRTEQDAEVPIADFGWQGAKTDSAPSTQTNVETLQETSLQENTVRIPVRQLDRLSDLFGELTIERNGLSLHLERLHNLMKTLSSRVGNLDQLNARLRTTYDTVATQASAVVTGLVAPVQSLATATNPNGRGVPPKTNYNAVSAFHYGFNAGDAPQVAATENSGEWENVIGKSTQDISSNFDALEMDHYGDLHLLSIELMETIVQIQEVASDIELGIEDTDQTTRELNRTAKQLQNNLTRLRMRPLSELVGRFSRALRDFSLQYGKQVELKVVGKGTLIDRSILEALSDPLMHLVRNAFDHGIEEPALRQAQGKPPKGRIEIKAAHRGNQTLITVSDDGGGINLDKIRDRAEEMGLDAELLAAASEDDLLSLIFEPGFSTADEVTALSGRGVGMDVVRNNLKEIRGDIRVDTQPGRGTTFTLTVPFTLSVARILLVETHGMLLAFPTDVIEEMLLLNSEMILTTLGSEVLKWQGEMVRLIRLGAWLQFQCPRKVTKPEGVPSIKEPAVMMINQGDQMIAIQVDRCWGEREVAIRQAEEPLNMPPGFVSCTILGDGRVVPLVDANELLQWIDKCESQAGLGKANLSSSAGVINRTPASSPPERWHQLDVPEVKSSVLPQAYPVLETVSVNNPPVVATPQSQKETVLVVDDSINVRRFLALALEKAGYFVEQAKDGQDAVEKLLAGLHVNAVICDIEMPRLDGYGFLAQIKSDPNFKNLPVAMLTSRSGEKHRQLAMNLGAAAYFSKPYNERVLLKTLKELTLSKV